MRVDKLIAELQSMPKEAEVLFAVNDLFIGVHNLKQRWYGYGDELYSDHDVETMTEEEKRILRIRKVVVL